MAKLKFLQKSTLLFFTSLFLIPGIRISAQEENAILDSLDTSIVIKEDKGYKPPDKIIFTPIFLNSRTKLTTEKWFRGVFYYTIDRLGYADTPYHYIVSSKGEIFNSNTSGDEKSVFIKGVEGTPVVIGYLSNSNTSYIDPTAEKAIEDLLTDIANKNAIKPDNILSTGTKFVRNTEENTLVMESADLFGQWQSSFKKITEKIKNRYSPLSKEYKVEVKQIKLSDEELTPGEETTASITIKNVGKYGLYSQTNSEIALTKEGSGASKFYINNNWLSQTQVSLMPEDSVLLPEKELTFDIKLNVPLHKGSFSETFNLKTIGGTDIESDKKVELKLNIKTTDKSIVEIKNNSAGFVNVRKSPTSAEVIRKVTPGERFFLLEVNQQTLWAKIDLGDGVEGWLAAWQFSYI